MHHPNTYRHHCERADHARQADETGADEDDDEDGGEEDVVWMTDTSQAAVAARAAQQLTAATAEMVTQARAHG